MFPLDVILTENRATSRDAGFFHHAVSCSPFLSRLLSKDADLVKDLLENLHQPCLVKDIKHKIQAKKNFDEIGLKQHLRQVRQYVLAKIILRDLNGLADFYEVVSAVSGFAEIAVQEAIHFHHEALASIHGQPMGATANPQSLIVVGMGKLGGLELNVSSDIDLIFAYEEDGETNGSKSISNQMFFTQLGKKVIATLDEVTADGFVFRVDMRLRPFGSEGALVSSVDALEDYYQNYGREWERYAWIKGRVIAGPEQLLTRVLKPFVFRKYLDFNAYAAMRDLKVQIQRDVLQRGLERNIKLGRGGIREVEFVAQVFQLIRGGQDTDLQIKPTLEVLKLLGEKKWLTPEAVEALTQSYIYLRNLEHRLMYIDDQQTQDLPVSEDSRQRLLRMLNIPSWEAFMQQLEQHRAVVQAHFDATFSDARPQGHEEEANIWQGVMPNEAAQHALTRLGYQDSALSLQRLHALHQSSRYQQLPEQSKRRLDKLMPLVIHHASETQLPDETLLRLINLIETICRRASYLALLAEFPDALTLVIKLCASSPWLTQYLSAHPILLDELLNIQNLYAIPDFSQLKSELEKKMGQFEGDTEAQMDAMRHFKHAAILRFAAQDVAAQLPLETLSDYLSDLAQMIMQVSLSTIWKTFKYKHCDTPRFAVIGYGKLGGKELGYMSDLDIIFLYDDPHPEASDNYARFAQRINNWFNSLTNAGHLYETDLQLRPDGNSGLLVSSVEAFREYQLHKAWAWEHQAITRARFIAGDTAIGDQFAEIRHQVMTLPREAQSLAQQVLEMRDKMRATRKPNPEWFDVKHDRGGIIDVEFIVQYLVLLHARMYPELSENRGNIALLGMLAAHRLLPEYLAQQVADAYRAYRKTIHSTKLQSQEARLSISEAEPLRQPVVDAWQYVFKE